MQEYKNPIANIINRTKVILSELDRHYELHTIKTRNALSLNQFLRQNCESIILHCQEQIEEIDTYNESLGRLYNKIKKKNLEASAMIYRIKKHGS